MPLKKNTRARKKRPSATDETLQFIWTKLARLEDRIKQLETSHSMSEMIHGLSLRAIRRIENKEAE